MLLLFRDSARHTPTPQFHFSLPLAASVRLARRRPRYTRPNRDSSEETSLYAVDDASARAPKVPFFHTTSNPCMAQDAVWEARRELVFGTCIGCSCACWVVVSVLSPHATRIVGSRRQICLSLRHPFPFPCPYFDSSCSAAALSDRCQTSHTSCWAIARERGTDSVYRPTSTLIYVSNAVLA